MHIELDSQDLETLLTSLDYSKQRVSDAPDTPYDVRCENLAKIDTVATKLRDARRQSRSEPS